MTAATEASLEVATERMRLGVQRHPYRVTCCDRTGLPAHKAGLGMNEGSDHCLT